MIYCVAIFAGLDALYSSFLLDTGLSPRIPSLTYHHALVRNFAGYDNWGDIRYPFYTNSLGFRDSAVREVAQQSTTGRILLMGDSFTEGVGVTFEESFAGRLQAAGLDRRDKTEFLNAAISYSPTIYYRKIRYLIEHGLRFDEVVLFSDVSDVMDEAGKYFCHDDDPQYAKYCSANQRAFFDSLCPSRDGNAPQSCDEGDQMAYVKPGIDDWLARHFAIGNFLRVATKVTIQKFTGNQKRRMLGVTSETGWVFPGSSDYPDYVPLGVEGGIARSLEHMQKLADLLKARDIPLTIVVYPWPAQIARGDRDSRQVRLWRDFCARNCKHFINLFPDFFDAAAAREDWYETFYIFGDFHFSPEGHRLVSRALADRLR